MAGSSQNAATSTASPFTPLRSSPLTPTRRPLRTSHSRLGRTLTSRLLCQADASAQAAAGSGGWTSSRAGVHGGDHRIQASKWHRTTRAIYDEPATRLTRGRSVQSPAKLRTESVTTGAAPGPRGPAHRSPPLQRGPHHETRRRPVVPQRDRTLRSSLSRRAPVPRQVSRGWCPPC
jgi:hypothetical protein